MRQALVFAGLVMSLNFTSGAKADPAPYAATIAQSEVEVRSGPSKEFYATTKLRYGDSVRVLRQEGEWIVIAPTTADFSWINASQVDQAGASATVKDAEAPLRVGSRLIDHEPDVGRAKVKKGQQLILLGNSQVGKDGTWLSVQPAQLEVRYIPVNAIQQGATTGQTGPPPLANSAPLANAAPAPAPAPTILASNAGKNPLLIEAEKAESSHNYDAAIKYYEDLSKQLNLSEHSLAVYCQNKAQYLRNIRQSATAVTQAPPANTVNGRLTSMNGCSYAPASYPCVPAIQPTSQNCYQGDSAHTVRLVAPAGTPSPPLAGQQAQWYGPGRLRTTALPAIGNKAVYALQNDKFETLMYVTAGDNVDLLRYMNPVQLIKVYGVVSFNSFDGALRNNYMSVMQVSPAP